MGDEPCCHPAWARANDVARRSFEARSWQYALTEALEVAVRPDAVGVFLCPLGNVLGASAAVAPKELRPLGERLVQEFLPRALRAGLLTPGALIGTSLPSEEEQRLVRAFVEPFGFEGLIGRFLRDESIAVAGWISIYLRSSSALRRRELAQSLRDVCVGAEATLRECLAIAKSLGARPPKLSPVLLSCREREVVPLAAAGFSDLNIAERLCISEGTVGRHLHSIFRKLGVSSRAQLGDLLIHERDPSESGSR